MKKSIFSLTAALVVVSLFIPFSTATAKDYRGHPGVKFRGGSGISLSIGSDRGVNYRFYYQESGRSHFRPHHSRGYRQYRYYNPPRYIVKPPVYYGGRGFYFKPPRHHHYRKPHHGRYGHFKPHRHYGRHYFKPQRHHRFYGHR